jgi:threonylcarbamoyladenosine tRNA methylthiotransferase MtaB
MASRPIEEVIAEAERLAASGCREIVVTGVLVGAYGQDGFVPTPVRELPRAAARQRPDLADLLLRLAGLPGIERVRLSSIEPTQVTDRLLDAFASEPKLCRHLHIPLQSGDTGVLAAMNRPYDQAFYLDRCRAAGACIPDLGLTTDIMVGFPGEERAAFENTLHVVREAGYARAHLFRYSPRPNTPGAELANQVPEAVKDERARELASLCAETQQRFIRRYLGRELEVLVEGKEHAPEETGSTGNDGHERIAALQPAGSRLLSGYTSNYIRVQLTGGSHLIGRIVRVRLLEPNSDGAVGEVVFRQD